LQQLFGQLNVMIREMLIHPVSVPEMLDSSLLQGVTAG
jgi:hypothetical protein